MIPNHPQHPPYLDELAKGHEPHVDASLIDPEAELVSLDEIIATYGTEWSSHPEFQSGFDPDEWEFDGFHWIRMDNCKCKLNSCFNQEHLSIA